MSEFNGHTPEQGEAYASMGKKEHTPLPWYWDQYGHLFGPPLAPCDVSRGKRHLHLAARGRDMNMGDQEFITRAVNNHDALIDALRHLDVFAPDSLEVGTHLGDTVTITMTAKCLRDIRKALADAEKPQ